MRQTVNKIQRAFSKSAERYDLFSSLHRGIADNLLTSVMPVPTPKVILDVGCGTGYLTGRLIENFPQSQVIGLDFAEGMLKVARSKHKGMALVLADGLQLPVAGEVIDLVFSNLSYQWATDLTQAFREVWRVLTKQGVLITSLFGYHTCDELFACLHEVEPSLTIRRLPTEKDVAGALMVSGFSSTQVHTQYRRLDFEDMYQLLSWLKSLGANHLSGQSFFGATKMAKAASIYQEKFSSSKGITASFEIIKVYAKR